MGDFVSDRAQRTEGSQTILANQKAEELRRRGVDVISLAIGEPDFHTPDNVKDAAKRALDENFTKYTASAGILELRQAVAEYSRRENQVEVDANHVLITPTKHALFASILATVNPGDEVLITDPCFVSYVPQVRFAGGIPVPVPLRREQGYSINATDVAEKITKKTKMIILCSPANPTGAVDDPGEVKGVVELAKDHDFLILSDEIYERIVYEGRRVSPASLPGGAERTITLNGLSKAYAMTGWRTGWLLAPSPVFEAIAKIQTHSITHITSFVQKASVEALRGPQDATKRMVEEFRARREVVLKELERTPGFSCVRPRGAFYAFPEYEYDIPSTKFAEWILENAHVAVVAGSAFGLQGERHLRLSYAASREKIQQAFERLRSALPKLEGKRVAVARRP